ncbi:MAG: inosine/xanthosine triphosphatase [Anaerolineae bacterium]
MQRIIIASTNPVKIQAAQTGFQQMFPYDSFLASGLSVPSGVADQPMTDEETLQGALNRAANARAADPQAAFWVGIEGGCEEKHGELWTFAWVVVLQNSPRYEGEGTGVRAGKGRTGAFCLPREVADLVRQGVELGEADDRVFGRSNSKQNNGAVGLLTGDVIDRQSYYVHAVVLALVPFRNQELRWG